MEENNEKMVENNEKMVENLARLALANLVFLPICANLCPKTIL